MKNLRDEYLRNLSLTIHVYLAICLVATIIFFVSRVSYHSLEKPSKVRSYTIEISVVGNPEDVAINEKKERLAYLLSTILVPLTILFSMFSLKKYLPPWLEKRGHKFLSRLDSISVGLTEISGFYLWVAVFFIIATSDFLFTSTIIVAGKREVYLHYKDLYTSSCTLVLSLFTACLAIFYSTIAGESFREKSAVIYGLVTALLSIFVSSFLFFDEHNLEGYSINFSPVIYPVIQTYLGKMPLIDLKSLYGLYPILLQPFLFFLPPTVANLSLLLACLLLISLLSIAFCLFSIVKNKLIAMIAFFAIIFLQYFANTWWPESSAIAFQYEPIRLLFPSLLLGFLCLFLKRPSKAKYYFGLIFFSLATMWNLDVGIPTFLVLAMILGYEKFFVKEQKKLAFTHLRHGNKERTTRNHIMRVKGTRMKKFDVRIVVRHLFESLGILATLWVGFFVFLRINYGHWPNISWLFYGQEAAFTFGYAMLPILYNDIWYIAALIYIVGVVLAIDNFLNKKYSFQNNFILVLALLGVGLFTYFLGRSHTSNIFHCGYPAIMLLAIFADKFCASFGKKDLIFIVPKLQPSALLFSLPLMLLSYLFVVALLHLSLFSPLHQSFSSKFFHNSHAIKPYWIDQAEFIKNHIPANSSDGVLILSLNNQDYYFASELSAKSPNSFVNLRHMFYESEINELYESIELKKNRWVIFFDKEKKDDVLSLSEAEILKLKNLLLKNYKVSSQLKEGNSVSLTIFEN